MARVLVSGASGPIAAALLPKLRDNGCEVVRLVRGTAASLKDGEPKDALTVPWDPMQPLDPAAVSGFDVAIHLAGEPIVGRWTDAKKRRIHESRAAGTRNLSNALAKAAQKPRVLVSASAIGFYGNRGDEVLREESSSGHDFLSAVCRDWEANTQAAAQAGIRTVNTRFGLILSRDGGALPKMLAPFRMGVGGNMGNGRQWWSWIHIADVAGGILHVMNNDTMQGPVNFVAPNPVTNATFTKILAAAQAGIRTVNTRFGLILSRDGGALPKMLPPFRMGVGGNMGNGRQWWSWIHVADVAGGILHVINNDKMQGPVNFVAPNPVTNATFTKILAAALHRPAIFPVPAFAARLAFGQMADELLLASQRVEPARLVASGYAFGYTDLRKALDNLVG